MTDTKIDMKELSRRSFKTILTRIFRGDSEKCKMVDMHNRINLACPYCGDSTRDNKKKRGNLYPASMMYKCYNCGVYKDFEKVLSDFNMTDDVSSDEKIEVRKRISSASAEREHINSMMLDNLINADYKAILIPRFRLMSELGLTDIHLNSDVGNYLNKRQQVIDSKFAWDSKSKRLFVFNLDSSGDYVFGLQVRYGSFSDKSSYKTYQLSKIYSKFLKCDDIDFLDKVAEHDHISTLFGILKVDFNIPVTIFEGPLDHFLYPNSVALCSISTPWPFDLDNRLFQDNDTAGKNMAIKWVTQGKSVFLWTKFLRDHGIMGKRIKDLNDILVYCVANRLKIRRLDEYFSKDKYDIIYI
jgi:hypothetical protein